MTRSDIVHTEVKTVSELIKENYGNDSLDVIFEVCKLQRVKRDKILHVFSFLVFLIKNKRNSSDLILDANMAILYDKKSSDSMIDISEDFFYSVARLKVDSWLIPKYSRNKTNI